MSDLRPTGTPLNIDGEERKLLFTFSVIDKIQEKYGPIQAHMDQMIADGEDIVLTMKRTIELLEILVNDEAERENDKEKRVAEGHFNNYVTTRNVYNIFALILVEYGMDLPEPDGDEDPNQTSVQ